MPTTIDLGDLKSHTLTLKLPGGESKDYDLYELFEKLYDAEPDPGKPTGYDRVREAFGFPTEAAAKDSGAFTPTRTQCEHLQATVFKETLALPEKQAFFGEVERLAKRFGSMG